MPVRMVRCPNCGNFRRTSSLGQVKCFFCGKSFEARKHIISDGEYKKRTRKNVGFR